MKNNQIGRLIVRVTVNGCGLPLDGAEIFVNGNSYIVPKDCDGFSNPISLFEADEKGISQLFTVKVKYEGFEDLTCDNIPVTSGYLTVWNMPLEPKSKKVKKLLKNEKIT